MQNAQQLYTEYVTIMQKAADLNYAAAVLGWDQETYMPPKGADYRGRQLATLATQAHEILTSDPFGKIVHQLAGMDGLDDTQSANIRLSVEDYERNKKLPPAFVEELSRLTSESFNAWIASRRQNDFSVFLPLLTKMIALKRKQADLYGYKAHPYDALLDEYEKGATIAMLDPVFKGISEQLPILLDKIKAAPQVSNDCFHRHFPKQQQWDFSIDVLKGMGFDLEAGRQDYSEHPFTTSFAPADVRLTTRVDENNYASLLWSCIHEGGHGLYEQGLPGEQYGLPLGAAASLGIHESQSRFWENCIGRSLGYWKHYYPILQKYFPTQLSDITVEDFFKAANRIEPSFIRTEADELTYHFHVMIRYELEKALIQGSLNPKDLREQWNAHYNKYLGITPKDDKTGVLQDVHWSHGMFGYFPTYSLGSFYASQFFGQVQKDIPGLHEKIQKGELQPILQWLRNKVHQYGRRYTSEELCERITGTKLDPQFFIQYASKKYSQIYGISL
ncbi:MAG: carboxypeptidase [Flavipsychrobacter sp.]|jgi:carboxypeptidase Taq|nr:carboxypeptidase [Flavipsychrobacter sp.]